MNRLFQALFSLAMATIKTREDLVLENLALRQQIEILQRTGGRPRATKADRVFWVALSKIWSGWRDSLVVFTPATVVAWHRKGFKLFWTWKSRVRLGRPGIDPEVRELIRMMNAANPLWGPPRIHGELLKLGFDVSQASVSRLLVRRRKPRSQTWRAFLDNHTRDIVSCDFFVVPTAVFRVLFVFMLLRHDRRQVVHFGVTANPTSAWTGQQLVEAFPWDTAPRYLLHDRDAIYSNDFRRRVHGMGIEEVRTAFRSPWQNPYCERLIGSIRHECLDHVVVLNEAHLRRLLASYAGYYHNARTHLSLEKDAPIPRTIHPPEGGTVTALPMVGGLHHQYVRCDN
jgi:transposase InsO family protein